jgi:hypothetical protein
MFVLTVLRMRQPSIEMRASPTGFGRPKGRSTEDFFLAGGTEYRWDGHDGDEEIDGYGGLRG